MSRTLLPSNGSNDCRIEARGIVQLRPLFLILDDEVRQPNLQLVPLFQSDCCRHQPLAVDVGAVRRAEVANDDAFAPNGQLAMPSAEPAVVDPHANDSAAAELDGEPINGDFTRRSQRVLAEELDLHGRREEGETAGGGRAGSVLPEAKTPIRSLVR